jgi:hypothetical protein
VRNGKDNERNRYKFTKITMKKLYLTTTSQFKISQKTKEKQDYFDNIRFIIRNYGHAKCTQKTQNKKTPTILFF